MNRLTNFVVKRSWIFLIVFLVLVGPAFWCYTKANSEVYYNMTETLPSDMECTVANTKLEKSLT